MSAPKINTFSILVVAYLFVPKGRKANINLLIEYWFNFHEINII